MKELLRFVWPATEEGRIPQWARRLTWVLLVLIFLVAAWARFSLPPVPFFNPDALGYAGPGLYHSVEGEMRQTNQRGFFYPFFLRLVMFGGEDLRWLTVVQHCFGLLAGLLWWLVWISWCGRLPLGWMRWGAGPGLGLFLLLVFLWSARGILLEHNVRPEAVFPFFALGQIAFTGWACLLWAGPPAYGKYGKAAGVCLFFAVCFGAAATGLKPSWILAWSGLACALVFVVWQKEGRMPRLVGFFTALLAAAATWAGAMHLAKHQLSWKLSKEPADFLSKTLVSVHAPQIVAFWRDSGRELSGEEEAFLARLEQGISESRQHRHSYFNLGFDPDFIFYRTKILNQVPVPPEQRADYLMGWYKGLLLQAPWRLLPKIAHQFWYAYTPNPSHLYADSLPVAQLYKRSLFDLEYQETHRPAALFAPWKPYLERTRELADGAPKKTRLSPPVNNLFLQMIGLFLPVALLLCLGGGIWFLARGSLENRIFVEPALWAAFSVGAVATVAIVHSFDIDRYQHNLTFLHLLVAGGGALILLHLCVAWWKSRRA